MIKTQFRSLNNYERKVLSKMLQEEFPGRREIIEQVSCSKVRLISGTNDNYGSIKFSTESDIYAQVRDRVPVIGTMKDKANGSVEVLLHVVAGKIDELEFIRMDGKPMEGVGKLGIKGVRNLCFIKVTWD